LPDPRQAGKVIYPRSLCCACWQCWRAAENFVEIARFGEKKIELLRRFLPFKDRTPSHDQLCDIFAMIDAMHFQRCFVARVAKMLGVWQMWSPSTNRSILATLRYRRSKVTCRAPAVPAATAAALTLSLYLLSQAPEFRDAVERELDHGAGDRPATLELAATRRMIPDKSP
jgi:DDE_Tnp_1-associated